MDMTLSRRAFGKLALGTGALATTGLLGRTAALATPVAGYKAMVGIFLDGGNDGWNMIVPNDDRYATYHSLRGSVALPTTSLVPLVGSAYSIHSALAPLVPLWKNGAMNIVLNTGTLYQPVTRAQFLSTPDMVPLNLMSHTDEQAHWQGLHARDINVDGFMGRITDRAGQSGLPANMSFAGSNLISIGQTTSPLLMGSTGAVVMEGGATTSADPASFARNSAMTAFADTTALGTITATTGSTVATGYSQNAAANAILTSSSSSVVKYFVDANGVALTSDIALQLLRVARMIEARATLGHSRQTFFVNQLGYDTHTSQIATHAGLLGQLGPAIAAFYNAMVGLGLSENVTTFTLSDFGRVYQGNGANGADHAWGNNHLVIGGAVRPQTIHGTYPSQVLGGPDDCASDGRFIPTIAQEEYIGAIAKWHGVAAADLPYVFPNWATWSTGGRGPLPMFQS